MNKKYLLIWSVVWLVLGILVALSAAKELMINPAANIIFSAGLTLFCFYNGIRGIIRVISKYDGNENDKNEEVGCSGG